MQAPPQASWFAGQVHSPPRHDRPVGQVTPTQARSVQRPEKHTESGSQSCEGQSSGRHSPPAQPSVAPHAWPQAPQFARSSFGSTQRSPQVRWGLPQTQAPCEQVCPAGQTTPTQARSVQWSSKQTDEGSQTSAGQSFGKQAELAQPCPGSHAFPQLPQFKSSISSFAHEVPQAVSAWAHDTAGAVWRKVRAYNPWPVAYGMLDGQPLRILSCVPAPRPAEAPPGTILADGAVFCVVTADAAVSVREVQGAGGRAMSARDYLRGHRDVVGRGLA